MPPQANPMQPALQPDQTAMQPALLGLTAPRPAPAVPPAPAPKADALPPHYQHGHFRVQPLDLTDTRYWVSADTPAAGTVYNVATYPDGHWYDREYQVQDRAEANIQPARHPQAPPAIPRLAPSLL